MLKLTLTTLIHRKSSIHTRNSPGQRTSSASPSPRPHADVPAITIALECAIPATVTAIKNSSKRGWRSAPVAGVRARARHTAKRSVCRKVRTMKKTTAQMSARQNWRNLRRNGVRFSGSRYKGLRLGSHLCLAT